MNNWIRTIGWMVLTAVATYVIAEWAVLQKSGLHDLREPAVVEPLPVPQEPERAALLAQMQKMTETFHEYRAAKDQQIAALQRLIANLERQIQVLTAQRTPVEQVAALRAASRPVRWTLASAGPAGTVPNLATLAREAGFTKVEVRR